MLLKVRSSGCTWFAWVREAVGFGKDREAKVRRQEGSAMTGSAKIRHPNWVRENSNESVSVSITLLESWLPICCPYFNGVTRGL
ncbi:hypothetical protein E3N88_20031 [Mikania micrantha]|uniref:Uncharacterized protein n=1 Tax=Mikania micrantha TaxID=192012 RepID=A0A5N6NIN2_9ASTR|nr:hypothetical protein E3N88_20031 [Mikania micrantha]